MHDPTQAPHATAGPPAVPRPGRRGLLPLPRDRRAQRAARLLLGLVLCGIGIGLQVAGDLGVAPWDVLHQGVALHTPLTIGQVSILTGVVVLLGWLPLRERLGVGTIANTLVIGLVVDATLAVVATPGSAAGRTALMLAGPVLFAVGSGFYIGAGMGPGPRDGLMTGLARRGHDVGLVRTGIEVAVLAGGFLLGGTVGVGTLWFAVGIGPMVRWTLPLLAVSDRPSRASGTGSPRGR